MPITEGGDTLIQCKVNRGVPSPRLHWYRPGNLTMSPRVKEISGVLKYIISYNCMAKQNNLYLPYRQ